MRVVRDLLLALVNATVLLLILLAVVVLMVVNRTDELADGVMEDLVPLGTRLAGIAATVERIEADLAARPVGAEAEALAAELAALRGDIAALEDRLAAVDSLTAEGIARAAAAYVAGLEQP